MSQFDEMYPIVPCGGALTIHALRFGLPWPNYTYRCYEEYEGDPLVYVGAHVTMIPTMPLFRIVPHYGTPLTDPNVAVTTHDWGFPGSEDPGEEDFELIEGRFDDFYAALAGFFGSGTKLTGYRWYKLDPDGDGTTGESIRFTERDTTMTSSVTMTAPQVACSVTQITYSRRRWGRFYLPFVSRENISGGRYSDGTVSAVANAAEDLEQPVEDSWFSIVYSKNLPYALPVQGVRVDNIPDIIRSRRWRAATKRETRVIPLP